VSWLVMTVAPTLGMLGYLAEGRPVIPNVSNSLIAIYGSFAVWLGMLTWLGFAKGHAGENRFGAPPPDAVLA
jgi:uncharacterized membrane protein YhaH (DUF805 family)